MAAQPSGVSTTPPSHFQLYNFNLGKVEKFEVFSVLVFKLRVKHVSLFGEDELDEIVRIRSPEMLSRCHGEEGDPIFIRRKDDT